MEKLYFDLTEHEFSKGRKILLWIFCFSFFLAGVAIVYMYLIEHDLAIHVSYSIAPFSISLFAGFIAVLASIKKKNHYFVIDDEKIEYRYGLVKPVFRSYRWDNIKEVHLAHMSIKVRLLHYDGTVSVVNLTWLEKKKSSAIRKHIYHASREKNIPVLKFRSFN